MTMVYVAVTQNDLRWRYHLARQALSQLHLMPQLSPPNWHSPPPEPAFRPCSNPLAATRHLFEMFRRQLESEKAGASSLVWPIASPRSGPNLTSSLPI
jgi:hypothetical protein